MHVLLLIFSHFQLKTITTIANSSNTCLQPQKLQNQTKLKERVLPRVALTYDSPLKEQLESEKEEKKLQSVAKPAPGLQTFVKNSSTAVDFSSKRPRGELSAVCVCAKICEKRDFRKEIQFSREERPHPPTLLSSRGIPTVLRASADEDQFRQAETSPQELQRNRPLWQPF